MPKSYVLDKVFTTNKDYPMSADKALMIAALGTDDTEDVTPKIDGKDLGVFTHEIAPQAKVYDLDLPPLQLGNFFYVVPPDKVLRFNSKSTANVRAIGKIYDLAPGETLPTTLMARWTEQGNKFVTYISGKAAAAKWADQAWVTLKELVPKTVEKYLFDRYVGYWVTGITTRAITKYRIRFTLDGKPLDNLLTAMGHLGIDCMSMYHPPYYDKNKEPFTLKDMPIELLGDHVLKVEAQNNTAAEITITADNYPLIYMICTYSKGS